MNDFIISIGRSEKSDYIIQEKTVSSEQAILVGKGGKLYVTDLDSTNHTFIEKNDVFKKVTKDIEVDFDSYLRFGRSEKCFVFDILYSCVTVVKNISYVEEGLKKFKESAVEKSVILTRCLECGGIMNIKLKRCPDCGV